MAADTTPIKKIYDWVFNRLSLGAFMPLVEEKKVPVHKHSYWYYLGGIALILLVEQIVTGVLLLVYYVPELKSAHASILTINSQVDFGWFIRSLHSWGANLFILVLFLHLFSTYFMKAYRKPREVTWLTGIGLIAIAMGFGFTGYLLPWDKVSFFATKVGLDITAQVPFVGEIMANLLRGGKMINQDTLSRFFDIHVMVLPLSIFALLGLHLLLITLHGMSEPKEFKERPPQKKQYEKFFPTFALKDAMVWVLVLNLLAVFVALFPWPVGEPANPFAPAPIGIKPEWYFLSMFQFLKLIPSKVGPIEGEQFGILVITLVGLSLALMPFIDRGQSERVSKFATGYGIFVALVLLILTIWGFVA